MFQTILCRFPQDSVSLTIAYYTYFQMLLNAEKSGEQENIDANRQWRGKSVVSEIEHITACYTKFSHRVRVILEVQLNEFVCYRFVRKPLQRNRAQGAIFNDEGEIKLIEFATRT